MTAVSSARRAAARRRAPRARPGELVGRLAQAILDRQLGIAIALVAVLPSLYAAVRGIRSGWWPVNDEALTGLAAFDVLNGHLPVMGPRTTTAFESGVETHHPGPLQYYLLAVPEAVSGDRPWGLLLGSVLITFALVLVAVLAACRVAGPVWATAVGGAFLALQWALGPDAGARPFNPNPGAFATLTLAVLTWVLLRERLEYLPHYAAVFSVAAQSHLGYVAFLPVPVLGLVLVGMWRWGRRRRALWPARGWRPADAGRHTAAARWSGAILALLWLPPLVELFRFSPNNLQQVLSYMEAPRGAVLPPGDGIPFVVGLLAPIPHGIVDAGVSEGVVHAHMVHDPRGDWAVAVGALIIVAVLAIAVLGSRAVTGRVRTEVLEWLPTRTESAAAQAALLMLGGSIVTVVTMPLSSVETPWVYLQLWAVNFFVWAIVLATLATRLTRFIGARVAQVLAGAVLVLGLVVALGSPVAARWTEGHGVAGMMPTLEAELARIASAEAESGGARLHVAIDADDLGGGYAVAPSIGYGLQHRYAIHLPAVWESEEDTDFRKAVSAPERSAWISIRRGVLSDGADGVDPRSRVVATISEPAGTEYTIFLRGPDHESRQ